MTKYLIIEYLGYEGEAFYSFESEKNPDTVKEEFNQYLSKSRAKREFEGFYGVKDWLMAESEVVTLEEFWERYKK